ncbi:hypothetical protein GCM10007860_12080 [Chitiniphilus shinanonensis]|uniref:Uncharacterized protein n=1 Tax=Chitiniphilus shinanonensis TaxID=553088 RepID=A0ABQ6BRI5_9NEIS|nr:hypothetical protein [Chitiniphilus shinanonensis]GLS04062.1 hypothetical protein GCM10007860_12080 [Chitiniphilus shinanonensis]
MLDVVFRKTEMGSEEMRTRAHALSPKLRQLLIMIDGKTPAGQLALQLPEKEMVHRLMELEWDGFIERVGGVGAGGPVATPKAAPAPAAAVSLEGTVISAGQMARIRTVLEMSNHNQLAGALDHLLHQLHGSMDKAVLEAAIGQWLQMMRERGHDAAAQTYLAQIRAALKG